MKDTIRANQVKSEESNNYYIGLINHDEAIQYYFDNVIKPSVLENDKVVQVPIIYGSPERWKSIRKDGYYRDNKGKIQIPLIMFRRTSFEKDRTVTRNLDANNPQVYVSKIRNYTKYNNYDRFSILNKTIPQKEITKIIVPDYIKITYECIVWCNYVTQLNDIIESIQYCESSYWGDMDKYRFYTTINSFNQTTEQNADEERFVKSDFSLTVNGYLVPNSIQKQLSIASNKAYTVSKVIMTENITL